MEAPIRIQAPYSHLFRGHSYPNAMHSNRDRDTDMSDSPHHERSFQFPFRPMAGNGGSHHHAVHSPTFSDRTLRAASREGTDVTSHHPTVLHPPHNPASQLTATSLRGYDRQYHPDQPRIGSTSLTRDNTSSMNMNHYSGSTGSPYRSQVTSAPLSPQRNAEPEGQAVQLPGVNHLLAEIRGDESSMQNARSLADRTGSHPYPPPDPHYPGPETYTTMADPRYSGPYSSVAPPHHQPRVVGHSTGSSFASAIISEPPSPHPFASQPYSPSSHYDDRSQQDYRARPLPHEMRAPPQDHYGREERPRSHSATMLPSLSHNQYPGPAPGVPYGSAFTMPSRNDPFMTRPPGFPPPPQQPLPDFYHNRPRVDSHIPQETYPGYNNFYPPQMPATNFIRKRRGNLPKEATKQLRAWFRAHDDSPYPTEDEKSQLCESTGLQMSQVNNWFINARRRMPRHEARARAEAEGSDPSGQERASTEMSDDSNAATEVAEQQAAVSAIQALAVDDAHSRNA